MGVWDQ
jgi:hypothetical protein